MIIKSFDPGKAGADAAADAEADEAPRETFEIVDIFQLTSAELRERYGVWVDGPGARDVDELMETLTAGAPVPPDLRRDRLARIAGQMPFLLPCFVARQQRPGAEAETFLTDGPPGKWSLFFDKDGEMSLVGCEDGRIVLAPQPVLDPDRRPAPRMLRRAGIIKGLKAAQRALRRRTEKPKASRRD